MVEISVIIPLYNGEKYIKRCYESINNQDFDKEVEIIFVDDGSSDNSLKILNELKKNNPKIIVISQENKKRPKFIGRLATTIIVEDGLWLG